MGDEEYITLQEAGDLVRDTVTPQEAKGLPYIGLEHIEQETLRLKNWGSGEDITSNKVRFKAGDILFGKLRPYFRKVIRPNFDGVCSTDIWVIRAKVGVSQSYLYYWLANWDFIDFATKGSEGTRMPRAKWNHVSNFKRRKLSYEAQEKIGNILGSLDAKTEHNQRMNRTLEEMAQALFKSWFIDFDPVVYNALEAGNPIPVRFEEKAERYQQDPELMPLPQETLALFPDGFEESELGWIPRGWTVEELGTVMENPRRTVKPQEMDPKTPHFGLEHMPRGSITLNTWGELGEVASNKYRFDKGEILFGKLRPYFHKVGVAPIDGVCSTDILVIKPISDEWFGFVLGHVSSTAYIEYATGTSTGTKMPRTSWRDMGKYKVAVPKGEITPSFNQRIKSFVKRINWSIHESRKLGKNRDCVLPKLISGEMLFGSESHYNYESIHQSLIQEK